VEEYAICGHQFKLTTETESNAVKSCTAHLIPQTNPIKTTLHTKTKRHYTKPLSRIHINHHSKYLQSNLKKLKLTYFVAALIDYYAINW